MDLTKQKTHPCGPGILALSDKEAAGYQAELHSAWKRKENKITRLFTFKDFIDAMQFVNSIAAIAEENNHHPDIAIFYNKVTLTLWTHAINGLSLNDFIIAAKIDKINKKK